MEVILPSETSIYFHRTTRCYIPEYRTIQYDLRSFPCLKAPRVDASLRLVPRLLTRFAWTLLPHKITRCFHAMLNSANSEELIHACESNISSATQEIPNSLWNRKEQMLFYCLYLKLQSRVGLSQWVKYFLNCCIARILDPTLLGISPSATKSRPAFGFI
jgi:hypothetical protein